MPRGDHRHIGGVFAFGRDAALLDPGPRGDPLVGRIDQGLEVFVGHDALRRIGPGAEDLGMNAECPFQSAETERRPRGAA